MHAPLRLAAVAALTLTLMTGASLAHTTRSGALEVVHPWVPPAEAGQSPRLRLSLTNHGDAPVTVTGVVAPVASEVVLLRGGAPVATVEIAPGRTLGPDQIGLRLRQLRTDLAEGKGLRLVLRLAEGAPVEITAAIGRATMAPETIVSPPG